VAKLDKRIILAKEATERETKNFNILFLFCKIISIKKESF
jgi:hypothetical protein